MIYFIHAEGTDLVKIGFTSGPIKQRLSQLQTGCPHRLVVIRAVNGSESGESRPHL